MPALVPGRHAGKVAIVTGAGQGIGRGVAKRLAQEGAHIIVAEFNKSNAEEVAAELSFLVANHSLIPSTLVTPIKFPKW